MKQFQAGILLPEHTAVLFLDDDGVFPNNEHLPLMKYEHAIQISNEEIAAEEVEKLLEENHWHHPWRNGVYDYHHYHSTAHEVLVCYAGSSELQMGGPRGVTLEFRQGDVLILPAGTAHKCLQATLDFKCIGAYPEDQLFDMNYGKIDERSKAIEHIFKLPLPSADPIYGLDGPLVFHWQLDVAKRA